MVRRGILGGMALVGAAVLVFLLVLRPERDRGELAGDPGRIIVDPTDGSARSPNTSAKAQAEVTEVKADRASPTSAQGWTVRGRLLRHSPEALEPALPVVGALLSLSLGEDAEEPKPDFAPREVRTGPDGRYEFAGVPGKANYRLDVDAEGCALQALGFELPEFDESGTKELPDIVLEEPERLVVIVKGPRGTVLVGASVEARPEWAPRKPGEGQIDLRGRAIEAKPGGEGEYVFERLPRGLLRIEASLPGYVDDEVQITLPRAETLELVLRKGESISGIVRTTAGDPISRARVSESSKEVQTDDGGRFHLEGLSCSRACYIHAAAEGFCDVFTTTIAEADIVLPRESTLSGRVLAASSGEPIAGAKVKNVKGGEDGDEIVTDGSGAFTLKKVPPGSHEIHVDHALYLPLVSDAWELGEGEPVKDIELELEAGLSVTGTVLSAATGDPVREATLNVRWFSESRDAFESRETICDGSGSFELRGLREEEYSVSVSASGFSELRTQARVSNTPGEEWTFTMEPEARIHGRVLDPDGKGVAGAQVHLSFRGDRAPDVLGQSWKQEVLTDSRGAYELSGLPAHDDHCLVASMNERVALAWVEGIVLQPGERKEIDIRFQRGGTVRGRVRTPGSFVPTDVSVSALPSTRIAGGLYVTYSWARGVETARPLPSGDFELKQLPAGRYTVLIGSDCCRPQKFSVELDDGSERFLDVVLEEGFSVAGRVVDIAGKPLEEVVLTVWLPGDNAFARSDEEGLFTARGLPSGRGAISAWVHGVEWTIPCDIPSSGNVVTVGAAAFVSGRVETRRRKAAPECDVEFLRWTGGVLEQAEYVSTDDASRFRAALSPGKYVVHATAEGFASPRLDIELHPGERREIVIEVFRGSSLEVVLELDGADSGEGWIYLETPGSVPVYEEAEFPDEITLEAVPPGPATLIAMVDEHGIALKEGLVVTAGTTARVELTVPRIQGFFGRITRRGEPLEGASVRLRGPSNPRIARTSKGGWYQLENLPPGEHEIEVEGSRWTEKVREGKATRLDIDLAAADVSGTVRVAGKPAAGVLVEATSLLDASDSSTETDADGEWSLDLLAPGEYAIVAGGVHRHLVLEEGQVEAKVAFDLETLPPPEDDEEAPPEDEG